MQYWKIFLHPCNLWQRESQPLFHQELEFALVICKLCFQKLKLSSSESVTFACGCTQTSVKALSVPLFFSEAILHSSKPVGAQESKASRQGLNGAHCVRGRTLLPVSVLGHTEHKFVVSCAASLAFGRASGLVQVAVGKKNSRNSTILLAYLHLRDVCMQMRSNEITNRLTEQHQHIM